ncbi:phosphonate ABC transporter, permease protein PhnE [Effusibacillus lacus]|uniref:Phosphonate ABC transporter, permease protein PhnE n=1 Tax=Effusibacillus lacus TaxID=1348429 RepID=A0A292YN67_9BACL|nr:phosphonate ABC transporter, permease protein PhnE [Effusibacillus lacus]
MRRKILFAALLLIMGWATVGVGLNPEDFLDIGKTFQFMLRFFPPDTSVLKEAIEQSVVTLQIALTGTFYALVVAFPCSFLLARNTGPKGLSGILRSIFSFVRSVPEIVWGLLFVVTVGLGPVAGVIAIFLHNIGVLGKLISELVEASDKETQEAIIAVGGNKVHTIGFAIVPEILPNVLSQYFYRLEVGIRTSLILGVIGAGGIGNMLFIDFKVFEYPAVLTEIIVIMILVLLIDAVGAWVRKKVM